MFAAESMERPESNRDRVVTSRTMASASQCSGAVTAAIVLPVTDDVEWDRFGGKPAATSAFCSEPSASAASRSRNTPAALKFQLRYRNTEKLSLILNRRGTFQSVNQTFKNYAEVILVIFLWYNTTKTLEPLMLFHKYPIK